MLGHVWHAIKAVIDVCIDSRHICKFDAGFGYSVRNVPRRFISHLRIHGGI